MLIIYKKRKSNSFGKGEYLILEINREIELKKKYSLFYACFYDTFQTPFFLIMSKGGRKV